MHTHTRDNMGKAGASLSIACEPSEFGSEQAEICASYNLLLTRCVLQLPLQVSTPHSAVQKSKIPNTDQNLTSQKRRRWPRPNPRLGCHTNLKFSLLKKHPMGDSCCVQFTHVDPEAWSAARPKRKPKTALLTESKTTPSTFESGSFS